MATASLHPRHNSLSTNPSNSADSNYASCPSSFPLEDFQSQPVFQRSPVPAALLPLAAISPVELDETKHSARAPIQLALAQPFHFPSAAADSPLPPWSAGRHD